MGGGGGNSNTKQYWNSTTQQYESTNKYNAKVIAKVTGNTNTQQQQPTNQQPVQPLTLPPANIESLADLQRTVNYLRLLRQRVGTQQTTGQQQQQEDTPGNVRTLQNLSAQVADNVSARLNFIDKPPLYKKPAYYLDRLTPFIKVYMWIIMRSENDNRRPNSQATFNTYKFPLFAEEDYAANNHLVSFKYDVMPKGNANVEITVIDVKQEIIDVVTLQLAKQGVVNLDIEYGWSVEPKVKSHKDLKDVLFTNTCQAVLSDVKVNYDERGVPTLTLFGFSDITLPGELRWKTPYSLLGQYPALALTVTEAMKALQAKLEWSFTSSGAPNRSNNQQKALNFYQLAKLFLKSKNIDNKVHIKDIVLKFLQYYNNSTSAEYEREVERPNMIINPPQQNDAVTAYIATISSMTPSQLDTESGTTLPEETINSNAIPFNVKKLNFMNDIISEPKDAPAQRAQQTQWNVLFRKLLVYERRYIQNIQHQYFSNFYVTCARSMSEVTRIHPYYMLQYVLNVVDDNLRGQLQNAKLVGIELLNVDSENDKGSAIYPLRNSGDNVIRNKFWPLPNENKQLIPLNDESEKYWRPISDFVCEPQTFWGQFFNVLCNNIKIKLDQRMTRQQARLYGVQEELEDAQGGLVTLPPLSMTCNFFTVERKGYEQNLRTLISVLKARKQYFESQGRQNDVSKLQTKIAQLESLLSAPDTNVKYYMMFFKDLLPSDTIFSESAGLTNLVQAYSYRIGGITDNRFNPGWPTASHVNFPDIISFTPEFDYWQAMQSMISNAQLDSTNTVDSVDIISTNQQREQELQEDAQRKKQAYSTWFNANRRSIQENETGQVDEMIAEFEAILTEWENVSGVRVSGLYADDEPLNFMIAQNYAQNRIYSGGLYGTVDRQRTVQELRRRIMMSARTIKATMGVLGDPSFIRQVMGKLIFLKFVNEDNSLSYFTGLYYIQNATHEIRSGNFITNLELMFASELNDSYSREQLVTLSYNQDRQIARLD